MRAHTLTTIQIYTHVNTRKRSCTPINSYIPVYKCIQTHTQIHIHTLYTRAYEHTNMSQTPMHTHTLAHAHTHTRTHAHTRTRTCTHKLKYNAQTIHCIRTNTHAYTHAHTRAYEHIHTHAHIHSYSFTHSRNHSHVHLKFNLLQCIGLYIGFRLYQNYC